MSIDRSLRRKGGLTRSRNVLTRGERVLQMKDQDTWKEGQSPIGLAKTRVIKVISGKKKKVKGPEDADAAAAPAAGGKAPAGGKAAAGAKPAAAAAAKPAAKAAGKK